jgi:hypothetical protein
MKRTSVWVPLAAAGVQLAALALCAWAMQNGRQRKALAKQQPRQALAVAEPVAATAAVAVTVVTAHVAAPEPAAPVAAERSPAAGAAAPAPAPAAAPPVMVVPPSPVTTGPRERGIPRFIINFADEDTQIVAADAGEGEIVFGIFSDGNIRCVDVDNGCYAGKAEGPRARMREVAGSRAFTVQMEPAADDRFEAIFVGGLHDAQRLVLVPLTESGRA